MSGGTASVTKLILPSAVDAYRIVEKFEANKHTTQLQTGYSGFSDYLAQFKCKEDSSCICELDVLETIPHLILECPVFCSKRPNLEQELNIKINLEQLSKIMASKERNVFLKYCIAVVKAVNNRKKVDQ